MSDLDSGLFSISISDGDDSAPEAAEPSKSTSAKTPGTARTAQSEEDFQAVKQGYRVKVENGELWKDIRLPSGDRVNKQELQSLLHAVEELYYFKRYEEGASFVRKVLDSEDGDGLDDNTKKSLVYYGSKCSQRASNTTK